MKSKRKGVTVKLMSREFREALSGDGDSVMKVLTESFGDETLARICIAYLAESASYQATSHKIVRWFFFVCGVGVTLAIGVAARIFS